MWGHDRAWLPPEQQEAARKLRLENAAKGLRRPVQVMEGNYHVMQGVCPWWDGVRDGRPFKYALDREARAPYFLAVTHTHVTSTLRARSATVMRASAAENVSSAFVSAGITTCVNNAEPADGGSS